jgi:hypothetical protein
MRAIRDSRFASLLTAFVVLIACVRAPSVHAETSLEYQVKAAFLYNFAKFVGWSDGTFESDSDPFHLCVLGEDPFDGALHAVLKDRKAQGRALELRIGDEISDPRTCHVAFVPAGRDPDVAQILQDLRGGGVLTVGESESFAEVGGIIRLYLEETKVRFDVNIGRADEEGLKVSSQLLKLARRVTK